jgi:cobalt-zinc-cadmium efflux system protein
MAAAWHKLPIAMMHQHAHEHSHPHDHSHCHGHAASEGMSRWKLGCAVALTLAFVVGEAIAGVLAHSLALLSDAGHNFADAAALALSWYALWIASKPAHPGMTYGYHRVGILAALVNAVSLVVIALLILWDAILRFQHPEPPHGWVMVGVALLAIVVNLVISFWLHAGAKHDINVRSAYLHMLGDALSACGVVAAGVIVALTGASIADPIASLLIAGLVLASSWGILKESVTILLEGTPVGMDMSMVEQAIGRVQGVEGIHDLHVWTLGPGVIACSCHVVVAEQSIRDGQQVIRAVVERLHVDFDINHSTVQVEVAGHEANEMYCTLRAGAKQPPCA